MNSIVRSTPILAFLCLILSCSGSKQIVQQSIENEPVEVEFQEDKVLVLFLDVAISDAQIRGAKIIDGYFRPLSEDLRQRETLRVQYLNDEGAVLFEKILDNPLIQYKEYSDENGELNRIRIEGEKSSVLLRSQHSEAVKMIRIEYGTNNQFETIATLPLLLSS